MGDVICAKCAHLGAQGSTWMSGQSHQDQKPIVRKSALLHSAAPLVATNRHTVGHKQIRSQWPAYMMVTVLRTNHLGTKGGR